MTTVTIHVSPQDAQLIYEKIEEALMFAEEYQPEPFKSREETLKECMKVEEDIKRMERILETLKPVRDKALIPPIPTPTGEQTKTEVQLPLEDAQLIQEKLNHASERLMEEVHHIEKVLKNLSEAITKEASAPSI